jgi:hypothetical protein
MSASDLQEFDWEDIGRALEAAGLVSPDIEYSDFEMDCPNCKETVSKEAGIEMIFFVLPPKQKLQECISRIIAIHDRATLRHTRGHIERFLANSLDRKSLRVQQSAPDIIT